METIIVTGGAGYIGSHACMVLRDTGYLPVTYDDLSTGWADAVQFGPLEQGHITDDSRLDEVFAKYEPVAVMHFAACSDIAESVLVSDRYHAVIEGGTKAVANAALRNGCKNFVMSSTCSVYGDRDGVALDESCAVHPNNPYGAAKSLAERYLIDTASQEGMNYLIFRYFNVAGADPNSTVGEWHRPETHLVPIILDAVQGKRPSIKVYGTDYDTPDGSCVRDYVHVMDVCDAHLRGLNWLRDGHPSGVFNLGTGRGYSVLEVIAAAEAVTGQTIALEHAARRPGDAASLVSGGMRAREQLGWRAERSDLATMIRDAWAWHQSGNYSR